MNKGLFFFVWLGACISAGALSAASNSTGMVFALIVMAAYWIALPCILGTKYEQEEKEKKEQDLLNYDRMCEINKRVCEAIRDIPVKGYRAKCKTCNPNLQTTMKFHFDSTGGWDQWYVEIYRACKDENCAYTQNNGRFIPEHFPTTLIKYDSQILDRDPNKIPTEDEKPICRMCNGKSCLELKRIVVDEATDEHYYFWHCTNYDSYQPSEYKRKF